VDTVKRAAIAGAARIDPYVAMLYLLSGYERTGQERHAAAALRIAQVPMMRRAAQGSGLLLLARMQNVAGLVQLRRGNLDLASVAFENGLDHVPPGNIGPTPVILRLNKAFVDIARNDTDDAAAQLAQEISSTDNFQKLVGLKVSTTEDRPFTLTIDDVNFLRSTAETIAAGIALRRQQTDDATALLNKALQSYPHQIGATSMLADIAAMRGDLAAAQAMRAAVTEQAQDENPYLEVALVHSTLSFTTDAVTLKRSQYVAR